MINTCSYSRLATFELCPKRAEFEYVLKIPIPERPLPKGKTEQANERGTRLHSQAEKFVCGEGDFPPELETFRKEYDALRRIYPTGILDIENQWGMDKDWKPVSWWDKLIWLRVRLDYFVRTSESRAIVIDLKTGKRAGNEIKHTEQGFFYSLVSFLRYPELKEIDLEFWYPDQDDLMYNRLSRARVLDWQASANSRLTAMTTCTDFVAKPNIFKCKWCPYGKNGTKNCEYAV